MQQPARKESVQQGVDVLKERWMSSKTQQKLLRADVATKMHYPAERIRKTSAEPQKGALVVGEQSILFLSEGPEGAQSIVLSHPISMVAQYKAVGEDVDYSLKREHLLKHAELLEFRYKLYSPEQAAKVVAAIDASVLVNTKLAARDTSADDLALLDPEIQAHQAYARAQSTVGEEVQRIAGERFKCTAVYYNDTPHFLDSGPERETVLAIVNARGVALLHHVSNTLEVFSWTQISGFGPKTHHSTDDTFSFKVEKGPGEIPEVVSLTTPHALVIHKLAVEYTNARAADPNLRGAAFPASYKPQEQA